MIDLQETPCVITVFFPAKIYFWHARIYHYKPQKLPREDTLFLRGALHLFYFNTSRVSWDKHNKLKKPPFLYLHGVVVCSFAFPRVSPIHEYLKSSNPRVVLSTNCPCARLGVLSIWTSRNTLSFVIFSRDIQHRRRRYLEWPGFYLSLVTRKRLLLGSDCDGLPRQDSARKRQ